MKSPFVLLVTLAAGSVAGQAQTQFNRAAWLLENCTEKSSTTPTQIVCDAYLKAALEISAGMEQLHRDVLLHGPGLICYPDRGLSVYEVKIIVLKYLRDHPKDLGNPPSAAVLMALVEALHSFRDILHQWPEGFWEQRWIERLDRR